MKNVVVRNIDRADAAVDADLNNRLLTQCVPERMPVKAAIGAQSSQA